MDGLSSAGSAIAVVSLAVQLADTAKQLYEFWTSIKDAPEDVRTVIVDLELLSSVLTEIASEAQHTAPNNTLAAVLQSCTGKLKSLTAFTNNLEPEFASKASGVRRWAAFKFVMRSEKLSRFQEGLESLKSTLTLAQQKRYSSLSRIQHEMQLEKLATIEQKLSSLSLQHPVTIVSTVSKDPADTQNHIAALRAAKACGDQTVEDQLLRLGFAVGSEKAVHQTSNQTETTDVTDKIHDNKLTPSPSDIIKSEKGENFSNSNFLTKRIWREWNTTNYFFGTIHTYSTIRQLQSNILDDQELDHEEHHYERQSSFMIRPAAWLVNLGLNSGLRVGIFNSSVWGWKSNLNTFCAVSDDSLIFNPSRDGNLSAVRGLFPRGLASVRNRHFDGETSLYVAAPSHHTELYIHLIAAGAEKSIRSEKFWWKNFSPILAACFSDADQLSRIIDILRLFTNEMDFVETDGDGWLALRCIDNFCNRVEPDLCKVSMNTHLFHWVLQLFSSEIRTQSIGEHYARLVESAFHPDEQKVATLLLDLGPVDAIDTEVEGGFTVLQYEFLWPGCPCLDTILAFDPDLHHLGLYPSASLREETPLSLALYSYESFWRFASALNKRHTDMHEFVLQEMQEYSPLMDDGWTELALLALFDDKFQPDLRYPDVRSCDECRHAFDGSHVRVGVAWQYYLNEFKGWHSQVVSETVNGQENLMDTVFEEIIQDQTSIDPMRNFDKISTGCSGDSSSGPELGACNVDQVSWEHRFRQHRVVCIHCWLDFKRGLGGPQWTMQNDSAGEDDSSEDGFSPYLFNT